MKAKILPLFYFLLFFFTASAVNAQNVTNLKPDSILKLYFGAKNDSSKIWFLAEYGASIRNAYPDSSFRTLIRVEKELVQKFKPQLTAEGELVKLNRFYHSAIGNIFVNLGHLELNRGNNDSALTYYENALRELKIIHDTQSELRAISGMGALLIKRGDIKKALEILTEGLTLSEQMNFEEGTASFLTNIAFIYTKQSQPKDALQFLKRALGLYEKRQNESKVANCLTNIGSVLNDLGQYNDALNFLEKSVPLLKKLNERNGLSTALGNIGEVYVNKNNYSKALSYYKESHALAEELGNKRKITFTKSKIAGCYLQMNELAPALKFASQSMEIARSLGFPEEIMTAAILLRNVHFKQGHFKEALQMDKLYHKMNDSLNNSRNRELIYKSKLNYEYEKKNVADSVRMEDERKINQALVSEGAARLSKEKTQRFILLGGFLLTLTFSGMIFTRFRSSQKQKQLIESQKRLVDAAQRRTIDSINYARKIQDSILPTQDEISVHFSDARIIYLPKEIVGGDLYWFHRAGNRIFVAVADCKDQGVGGALKTMVAHSLLTEIVLEDKLTDPVYILSKLHEQMEVKFHASDVFSSVFEISIACIDHDAKQVSLAANCRNSFLTCNNRVIHSGDSDVSDSLIWSDRTNSENAGFSRSFTEKGNYQLILYTDGIQKQLNEEKIEFGTQRARDLINTIASTSGDRTDHIRETLNTYKNKLPQTDDVLFAYFNLTIK